MTLEIDPAHWRAVIFDLDGVITDTASLHRAAWKQMFDEYLGRRRASARSEDHGPFTGDDYDRYVDGKPRYDGVADLLRSRGVELPRGVPDDPPDRETICGLGNRKNGYYRELLERNDVQPFPDAVGLVERLESAGIAIAVFSSSRNARRVLAQAGMADRFGVRVDGETAAAEDLPGKPDPAVLLETARRLGVDPTRSVVVEDAVAGIEAARRGGFGQVVGLDRSRSGSLDGAGADVVLTDLDQLTVAKDHDVRGPKTRLSELANALGEWERFRDSLGTGPVEVFLDFDGTLSRIVDQPDDATVDEAVTEALRALSSVARVSVVSGRALGDVRSRVGVPGLWYAGSHGFEIEGPGMEPFTVEEAERQRPAVERAAEELAGTVGRIPGCELEPKPFSVAVHYRRVDEDRHDDLVETVERIAREQGLRCSPGRAVVEVRPDVDWHKGRALERLRDQASGAERDGSIAVYIGDDFTDEDAFAVLGPGDVGVIVRHTEQGDRLTAADWALEDPDETAELLGRVAVSLRETRTPR